MQKNALNTLSVNAVIELIKSKKVSVRELITASFKQIERVDGVIKAWVCLDKNNAMKEAELIDSKILKGESVGSLYGIPVGIKDIINTSTMTTEMGSVIWKGFMAGNDARIITNLKSNDAIMLGKTSTAEFAVHTPNKTVNPHNPIYAPGTSSSGSVVAVAAYMVPLALGTQTAGSIIRPASYCGVFGFKPSFGLIPRTGVLKTTDSLDQIGFFVRSCDDLKLIFDVIRVKGLNYPVSHKYMSSKKLQNKKGKKWKVGVIKSPLWVFEYIEPYVKDGLDRFINNLSRDSGIEIVEIKLGSEFNSAHRIHDLIYEKTLSYYFKKEYAKQRNLISKILREMIERGNKISLNEYFQALDTQAALAKKLHEKFEEIDVIITYSTAGVAMKGLDAIDKPDTCLIWTLCWVPVINIPVFKGPEDLPFGIQAVARRYNDILLLNFISYLKARNLISDGTYPDIREKVMHLKK